MLTLNYQKIVTEMCTATEAHDLLAVKISDTLLSVAIAKQL